MSRATDHTFDHAGLEILTPEECDALLAASPVGRLGFLDHGEPMVLPVTIGLWERSVVFSTDAGSKLDAAIMSRPVVIEIDEWDAETRQGWSVVVKGLALIVHEPREIAALDRLHVTSWVRPGSPKTWVRVLPNEISGRRIVPEGSDQPAHG
jgi:nitroimidazol reductase NimA-like FMN-containing flavoprotein (pyridoxamine 5'-phosphate oxidase superfamily)